MVDEVLEGGGSLRGVAIECGRILAQDRGHRLGRRGPRERAPARRHLIQHAPEREDVGALVRGLAGHLLRAHVAHRAHHRARIRHAEQRPPVGCLVAGIRCGLSREAEVEDLHASVCGDEDVLRLDVAMNDAPVMGSGETVGDVGSDLQYFPHRQRAVIESHAQGLALEQLRDGVSDAIVLSEIVQSQDVRMRKRGHSPGLALEPRSRRLVGGETRGEDLDGHLASERRVRGAIHLAHPAFAELGLDPVLTENGADHGRVQGLEAARDIGAADYMAAVLELPRDGRHPLAGATCPWPKRL